MSGHSKWSDIRRRLDPEGRARVTSMADQMAEAETLEEAATSQADRTREALGIPSDMRLRFGPAADSAPEDLAE